MLVEATGKPLKKFAVFAHYMGPEHVKRPFYVMATNKKNAKIIFKDWCPWLDVYRVEEVNEHERSN